MGWKKINLKIFVAYHQPWKVYEDDVFVPIQVWKKESSFDLWILWDDTWDNISYLNDKYSELTWQYWVWKNYDLTDVDYVWFFHYRRFFTYSSKITDIFSLIRKFWISRGCYNSYVEHIKFISERGVNFKKLWLEIYDYITKNCFDVYLPKYHYAVSWKYLSKLFTSSKNIRELILESIKQTAPLYYSSAVDTVKGYESFMIHKYNHRNMFIMNKAYFYKYMEFQFNVLFKLYQLLKENKLDKFDNNWKRIMWYYSESFINFFTAFEEKYCGCKVSRDANILFLEN